MGKRVALDADVLKLLVNALNWGGGAAPYAESVATVRIYFYLTNPVVTPTIATEVEQANEPVLSNGKNYHCEESSQDDFYRGCVKGMAEQYIDYHPDPRDCRVVAEAECAKVEALVTVNDQRTDANIALIGRSHGVCRQQPLYGRVAAGVLRHL